MSKLKKFENFSQTTSDINILLDVSGSILEEDVMTGLNSVDLGNYNKINLITFISEVTNHVVINDIDEIFSNIVAGGGGTLIQPAVDFVIDEDLNYNKTFIVSDFYAPEADYSELSDYELITVE